MSIFLGEKFHVLCATCVHIPLMCLVKQKIKTTDIDLVIPHQASITAIEAYINYGKFKKEQVINVIGITGNCVAASLPMSLAIAYKNNQISRGDRIYLTGTGAGLSIISALIKF